MLMFTPMTYTKLSVHLGAESTKPICRNEVTSVLLFIQQSKVQLSTLKLVFDLLIPKRVQLSNPQPSHPQAGYP